MIYVGKEVCVLSGQYKNTKGIISATGLMKPHFTLIKEDGTKIKVPYKDLLPYKFSKKRNDGDLALLRKSIVVDGVKQSFTLCKILYRVPSQQKNKNHMSKIVVKTVNDDEIEVNCNAILVLEL